MESEIERKSSISAATLPQEILEKLKCFLCGEYLSQLPIYLYPHLKQAACGRCPVLTEEDPIRNKTIEALASCLYFPCRYKVNGCLQVFAVPEIKPHEDCCTYKQYFCPVIPLGACSWQGNFEEVVDHYKQYHPERILDNTISNFDLLSTHEKDYLFCNVGNLFILYLNCDLKEDMIWWSVVYIGNQNVTKQYSYRIELESSTTSQKIHLKKQAIKNCDYVYFDKQTDLNIKISYVRNLLGDSIMVRCSIHSANDLQMGDSEEPKAMNCKNELLDELKCPVCNGYMNSPIYQCVSGHKFCYNCKPLLQHCPICRSAISNTRDLTLENLAAHVMLYCKNKKFGCADVLRVSLYPNHVRDCLFKPTKCPFQTLGCEWKGNKCDIIQHALDIHKENVIESNSCISCSFTDTNFSKLYLVEAHKNLFVLHFKYENSSFYWCLQTEEDADSFSYEVDVFHKLNLIERFYFRHQCVTTLPTNYLKVPQELISHLITDGEIVYRFQLLKDRNSNKFI